jgi:hypothetical protein
MEMNEELRKELDKLKGTRMSVKETAAQRISFVYGNAEKEDKGTKASVKKSLETAAL